MYPHISRKDAEAGINSSWVRTLNERCFHFSCWADPDALAAQLSAPRQLQASSSTMHSTDSWQRDPHFCPEQHAADLMKDGPSSGQGGWSDRGRGARSSARGGRASDRGGRQSDRGGRGRGSPRGGQSSWGGSEEGSQFAGWAGQRQAGPQQVSSAPLEAEGLSLAGNMLIRTPCLLA